MFPLFQENSSGLTIITNGGNEFLYGRKDGEIKAFQPYRVDVKSTLGAGDTFKAGCTYAKKGDIQPADLSPWIGFVYTFQKSRGQHCVGRLSEEIGRLAKSGNVGRACK